MHANAQHEESILYKCPLCGGVVEIKEHLIGELMECPRCDRPFEAVAPKAFPLKDQSHVDAGSVMKADTVADDETVERTIHPVVFRRHFLGTLVFTLLTLASIGGLALGLAGEAIMGFSGLVLIVPSLILLVIGGGFLLKWFVASRMQSLLMTNERMIYQYGIINRGTSEVRYEDVRNIKVDQNIMERLLGFGDIAVSSSGQDGMEVIINDIPAPNAVVEFVRKRQ